MYAYVSLNPEFGKQMLGWCVKCVHACVKNNQVAYHMLYAKLTLIFLYYSTSGALILWYFLIFLIMHIVIYYIFLNTVESLYNGHFGTSYFLLQHRGFPLSKVKNILVTLVGTKSFVLILEVYFMIRRFDKRGSTVIVITLSDRMVDTN